MPKIPLLIRRVAGSSMLPTLKEGQLVIGWRISQPAKKQIVIAKQNGREVIKRIAEIDGDNIYLLGDNLQQSTDSRNFGPVKPQDILAVLLWPRFN